MLKFKFFSHTADIKFRAYGKNIEESFENSVYALIKSISNSKIEESKKIKIKVSGKDMESLLYNFLEEFLFLLDSENFFVAKVKVKIKDFTLEAEAFGDSVKNYETHIDVKAVTYNNMFVKKEKDKWVAQVVLDV